MRIVSLRLTIVALCGLLPSCIAGCGIIRQVTSPDLRLLCDKYGATSIPDRDQLIIFQGPHPLDDNDLAQAFPYLQNYQPEELVFNGRHISDLSISLLLQLKTLRHLGLQGTRVSLSGLQRLRQLPNLRELQIKKGQFTTDELADLRHALPGVNVLETPIVIEDMP